MLAKLDSKLDAKFSHSNSSYSGKVAVAEG